MNIDNYSQYKIQFPLDSLKATQLREAAYQSYLQQGLPTKKEEAWKYTSLSSLKNLNIQIPLEETLLSHDELKLLSNQISADFTNFVFINGKLNNTLSDDLEDIANLIVKVVETEEKDFLALDLSTKNSVEGKLVNLQKTTLHEKVSITVKSGKILEKPIQIVFVNKGNVSKLVQPYVEVNVEKSAQAQILQNFFSINADVNINNSTLKIHLKENSNLKFIQMQNENIYSYHFSKTSIHLESRAQLKSLDVALGGVTNRHYFEVIFNDQGASAEVFGLSVLAKNQHTDHYTFIHHQKGQNQSVQHYKSLLSDEAHSVFRGRVRIEQDAQKANSEQLNNNLLLTRQAQAESIPQLEIYADDVKAGHGSTMGQLSADEIFYFLSRGIDNSKAIKMLSVGFASELVYRIDDLALQEWVINKVNHKLEGMISHV